MPGRQGQFRSWLEHSQHLAHRVNRRWKKHHTEAADHGIEGIGWEGQIVCKGDLKLRIPEPTLVCRPASGCHHLRDRIYSNDLAAGSHHGS
jgi:hypothetical protein